MTLIRYAHDIRKYRTPPTPKCRRVDVTEPLTKDTSEKIDKNNNRLELTANLQHLYHGLNYALHSCVNDLVLVTLGTLFL